MAVEQFLHGVEVIDIDGGARPISTVKSSVIGIVGTAPDADPVAFPLNTPVLVAGSRIEAAKLDMTGLGLGTLPSAMDSIFDQCGAVVIVVRVAKEVTDIATLANILGGVDAITGQYKGVHAFRAAQSTLGYQPRLLCAPGFTHQRVTGGVVTLTGMAGSGYTDGTYPLTITGGTGGSGATATATILGGVVTKRAITNSGSGYTVAPTFALTGAGAGTGATFAPGLGSAGNAVVAELVGIADRLKATIFADGPSTNDAAAIAYAGDFGSKRIYVIDPKVLKTEDGVLVTQYSSAGAVGIQARIDNDLGFWWSPSNQLFNGIQGTERAIDFTLGDANSRANMLNEKKVATIIREDGYRLWGNRTLSSDPKWAFLCVVRTADIINDSLLRAHLWAVDRGITKNYMTEVVEGVNAYLRHLTAIGAILGGKCYADPDLNTPLQIAQGKVYFDFDFTPVYPAEHITFRSHLVNDYIKEIF
ncbi:phage tail sheath subtilisin-like domain-containing protein [Massilia sp. DJPM01]|uniref:phage tail sheath C-terminal domain-containing protein n=1 Tax=Massilia sp. DJPM01 TaxID=3024404 RepID=UPI00259DFFC2|nr:phage tail sheath C-terminal domain-containing protein [Massilia sp. DJPM01]MDM5178524.1 phage tail sheath subtilisin-like domain-containing protein [Massilia sp. DJPM01]